MTGSVAGRISRQLLIVRKLASSNQVSGWLDQAIVSAANFLALIMVARWAGVAQVGYYAIGYSILVMAMAAQDSLVTKPYSIQLFKTTERPEAHAFFAMAFSLLLSVVLAAILAISSALLFLFDGEREFATLLLVLAGVTPLALSREFARRYSFAHLLMGQALAIDISTSVMLLLSLSGLALTGYLSAGTALGALGLAYGLGVGAWLAVKYRSFVPQADAMRSMLRRSWQIGKWLFASQIAVQAQGYATYWLALFVVGVSATGIYSACQSVIGLANPFLFGFFNILTPRYVRTLRDVGTFGLRRQAAFDALLVGVVMGVFSLGILLFGRELMHLLFAREEFVSSAQILSTLALAAAVGSIGAPATIALSAVERGRAIASFSFGACIVSSVLVWLLMKQWGLTGAAYGILLTEALGSIGRWVLFLYDGEKAKLPAAPQSAV